VYAKNDGVLLPRHVEVVHKSPLYGAARRRQSWKAAEPEPPTQKSARDTKLSTRFLLQNI